MGCLAGSLLDCYRRHPFLRDVDMAAAATDQPASIALLEEVLGELVGCGFTPEAALTALALVMLVVQAVGGLGPAPQIEEERARLLALASEGGARLTVEAYAHSEWSAEVQLRRLLPVVLAGIKAELAPARRRGRA